VASIAQDSFLSLPKKEEKRREKKRKEKKRKSVRLTSV
jgi:hypothetical protein